MAGHAQLKFVMTECSKTQIRLTGLILPHSSFLFLHTSLMDDTHFMDVNIDKVLIKIYVCVCLSMIDLGRRTTEKATALIIKLIVTRFSSL